MQEALLYEKLPKGRVKCHLCQLRCVISEGKAGVCRVRENAGGVLYALNYEWASSVCVDPIEKKPLYHFYPGTLCFSLGTLGCNFRCPGCQNWQISHVGMEEAGKTRRVTVKESVREALRQGCRTISWTYNEPTIWFEYTLDGAKAARSAGLDTVYVTNGFITPEGLDLIGPHLGAFRVDLKGFSRSSYKRVTGISKFEGILEVAARAKHHWGMHVECVTNLTPTINDDENELRAMAAWIRKELGPETPWHVTRFYPYLDLSHLPPTPVPALVRAREIGLEEGLHYVYLGNVPGHAYDNTYCHGCGELLIERAGYFLVQNRIVAGRCPRCGTAIPGRFQ